MTSLSVVDECVCKEYSSARSVAFETLSKVPPENLIKWLGQVGTPEDTWEISSKFHPPSVRNFSGISTQTMIRLLSLAHCYTEPGE